MARVVVFCLSALCLSSARASTAVAFDAVVTWHTVAGASAYRLYVSRDGGAYALAHQAGASAAPTMSHVLRGLPLVPLTRFAVSAVGPTGAESLLSNERSIDYALAASFADSDGDGLSDAEEDLDLDGVVDDGETDPRNADSDGDGLRDFDEGTYYGSDPLQSDSDGDCAADAVEVAAATNPHSSGSSPNVWLLAADDDGVFSGAMTASSQYAAGTDADPAADSIGAELVYADSAVNAALPGSGDEVRYGVDLPVTAQWYLWARLYSPGEPGSNDANSFFVSVDGGDALRLGNSRSFFQVWHWAGDGAAEVGEPVALALGWLGAGPHVVTVEKREVWPLAPRLDVLLLTPDASAAPTDGAALGALSGPLVCDGDGDCDGLLDAADPCPDDARNACFGEVAVDRRENLPIRIHAGKSRATCVGRHVDCNGDVWVSDFGYRHRRGSRSCTLGMGCPIVGVDELWGCTDAETEDMFRCDHSSVRPNRRIDYDFFLPNGVYLVNLYFANTQQDTTRAGDRVFSISVEGETRCRRFDQMKVADRSGRVVVRSALVESVDGNGITITLRPRSGEVALKAIEVLAER